MKDYFNLTLGKYRKSCNRHQAACKRKKSAKNYRRVKKHYHETMRLASIVNREAKQGMYD